MDPPKGDLRCLGRDNDDVDLLFGVGFLTFLNSRVEFLVGRVGGSANVWKCKVARFLQVLKRGRSLGLLGQDK